MARKKNLPKGKYKKTNWDVIINRSDAEVVEYPIVGTSPLMVFRFSKKSEEQMKEAQGQEAVSGRRPPRVPEQEYEASMYRGENGEYLFRSSAFRLAMISACGRVLKDKKFPMTVAVSVINSPVEFVEIFGTPVMDCRPVRLKDGTVTLRYRARFDEWRCIVPIRFNGRATNLQQVTNLLVLAGEWIGVGEYRLERKGSYGGFCIKEFAQEKKAS